MSSLPFLLQRLLGQPLLCDRPTALAALAFVGGRGGVEALFEGGHLHQLDTLRMEAEGNRRPWREYSVSQDGIATIPVVGSLVSRSTSLRPPSGLQGYSAIGQALETAAEDTSIRGIMLDISSGGGEAEGAFGLAELTRQIAHVTPVWAVVNELGASSAYAIAAGAERILAPRSARIGSIGAIALVEDRSAELARKGRVVRIIRSAPRKSRPSGLEGLTDADLADVQIRVAELHDSFVALVAGLREIPPEAVSSTEGAILGAEQALEIGLIDQIVAAHQIHDLFAAYLAGTSPASHAQEPYAMPILNRSPGAPVPALDAATMSAARREVVARLGAVAAIPQAAGPWQSLAQHLALSSDMSTADIQATLVVAQAAAAAEDSGADPSFYARMAGVPNPDLGPGEVAGDDSESLDSLLASLRRIEGRSPADPSIRRPAPTSDKD